MQDAITSVINAADVQGKYLDFFEGLCRRCLF